MISKELQQTTDLLVNDKNVRLDRYIRRSFPYLQQSVIEKFLRKGLIKVDGSRVKSSTRINSGQIITIRNISSNNDKKNSQHKNTQLALLIKSNILYEDEYILAVNKPAKVIVQGGKTSISDILDQIREGEKFKIVHRLDRDTSGVIIFARNTMVARYFMEEFRERRVKKTYLALTAGIPSEDHGVIDYPLVKKYVFGQEKVVVDADAPQRAITHFSILERLKHNVAYLELKPITGRTHQLRAHLAHINCPILGDGKYGNKEAFVDKVANMIHLHSYSLAVKLPNNKNITITAPIAEHIEQSIRMLNPLQNNNTVPRHSRQNVAYI